MTGRTRLRFPALRTEPDRAQGLADALAATPGVHEVAIRPYTGSVLVTHDPEVTSADLVEIARRELDVEQVIQHGEREPVDANAPTLSRIAQLAANAFREIDHDVLRASQGALDLGTLATLGFFGAGAVDVFLKREIEMPPWFNLAWWGYRTFMTNEQEEIEAWSDGARADHADTSG